MLTYAMSWMKTTKGLLVAVLLGFTLGLMAMRAVVASGLVQEEYTPPVAMKDGGKMLEKSPRKVVPPASEVPKGAVVVRVVYVTVTPNNFNSSEVTTLTPGIQDQAGQPLHSSQPCPPVRVSLTHVRMPDGSSRVVAHSPDGVLSEGIDIPVSTAKLYDARKHALGIRAALSSDGSKSYGPTYDYDFRYTRIGADINYVKHTLNLNQQRAEWTIGARFLVRF